MCGLCEAESIGLCYSDLLPKAVVRWVRFSAEPNGLNPNPIFVTEKTAKPINFRLAEHFLCPECEDRLNKNGETWTLRNAYRGKSTFPLRDAISQAPVILSLSQTHRINAKSFPTVDLEKLIYFGASIFWKASARQWWALDHPTQLEFGLYEDCLGQFLLGKRPFPERASLLINLSGNPNPHVGAIYPYGGGRVQGTRQYRFAIPGIAFWLHLGQIPAPLRAMCAHHSATVCLTPDLNEMFVRDMGSLIAKSERFRASKLR